MGRDNEKLELSREADGFGFYYGWVHRCGHSVRVDVMPPQAEWSGDFLMAEHKPDPKAWIIYINGEEVARVARREDIAGSLALPSPHRGAELLCCGGSGRR